MRKIEDVLDAYLSEQTDYAIQINGNWGVGKTFYYNSKLVEKIENTPIRKNNKKNYKPIYVSLFGFKSVEEVQVQIIQSLFQLSYFKKYFKIRRKSKILRVSEGVVRILIKGKMALRGLGDYNEYLTEIVKVGETTLDAEEMVVCFDDFERIDSKLSINDLIGYLNTLTEAGVKVLVISNEDKLRKSSKKDFKRFKEKIIDITIPFSVDTSEVVESIIKKRFSGFQVYQDYLMNNIDTAVSIADNSGNNYRHLIYALKSFQTVFSKLSNEVINTNHEIRDLLELNLETILNIYLAIAVEYKSGTISYEDKLLFDEQVIPIFELAQGVTTSSTVIRSKESGEDTKEKASAFTFSQFEKSYGVSRYKYQFYHSIFAFITNKSEFKTVDFIREFVERFRLNAGEIPSEYKCYNSLSYGELLKKSEEDYISATKELVNYAKEGKFLPYEYLSIMFYAERFNNPSGLDLEETKESLKAGLKLSISKINEVGTTFFHQFHMSLSDQMSKENDELYNHGIALFNERDDELRLNRKKELVEDVLTQPKEFVTKFHQDSDFHSDIQSTEFLSQIEPNAWFEAMKSTDFESLYYWNKFLNTRSKMHDVIKNEVDQIRALGQLISEALSEPNNFGGLQKHFLNEIENTISKIRV